MAHRRLNAITNHLCAGKTKKGKPIVHHHGKGEVRIVKLFRAKYPKKHIVKQFAIQTILEGPVDDAFMKGDNSGIVATDTQKNTIYVLGRSKVFRTAEEFALIIARHFVSTYPKVVHSAKVTITEDIWERLEVPDSNGKIVGHHHAFQKIGPHQGWACARAERHKDHSVGLSLSSGIRKLTVLKTTKSSFTNFVRDEYTLLPDADDRLMGTAVDATWDYDEDFIKSNKNWENMRKGVHDALIQTFSGPADVGKHSVSVQKTAFDMGCAALRTNENIDCITLMLPNIHNIPVKLDLLGLENKDHTGLPDVFVPTSEPYGIIQVAVNRDSLEDIKEDKVVKPQPVQVANPAKSGKSQITTHVLDTSLGRPAKGITISLQEPNGTGWSTISSGITNSDGRVSNLLDGDQLLTPGIYRMHFETGSYYTALGNKTFYPEASVVFETFDTEHYHVPLLLNPFGYSTYRGS